MKEQMTNQSSGTDETTLIPHSEPMTSTASMDVAQEVESGQSRGWKSIVKLIGPGVITGASDDDPSGIATYTAAGASLGYTPLWMALFTFPLMATIQYLCAKVGMVTGRGLAGVLKRHYSPWILYPAVISLLIANTINAGADLGAIADAIHLFIPIPAIVLIIVIGLLLMSLQIWGNYRLIANTFRWLTLALFAYIIASFFSHPDTIVTLKSTFIPGIKLDKAFLATTVAILGTTISPYLFFWQSNQEVEEEISKGHTQLWQRKGASRSQLKFAALDVIIRMLISNLVMYCIILTSAATLFKAGKHDVQSTTDAIQALRPLADNLAGIIFTIGIVGAGCLAIPVLIGSAAYALSESLGWKFGLDRKVRKARPFYGIIAVTTLISIVINFIGINPIQALVWSAIINGVLAPPLLVLLMLITNNKHIMAKHTNTLIFNILGWLTTILMAAAAIAMFFTLGQ